MMISEEARVSPSVVWKAWSKAHALHGSAQLQNGSKGQMQSSSNKKVAYQLIDVVPDTSFSILWKTMFVRMIFTYEVKPFRSGSQIRQGFRVEGLFAWPVRFFLSAKIKSHLSFALKQFVKQF